MLSRLYGDVVIGERSVKWLLKLQPVTTSPYVLLSNLYATDGMWDSVAEARLEVERLKKEKKLSFALSPGRFFSFYHLNVFLFSLMRNTHIFPWLFSHSNILPSSLLCMQPHVLLPNLFNMWGPRVLLSNLLNIWWSRVIFFSLPSNHS